MSQLSSIVSAQKSLEESFTRRMEQLEAQLQSGGPAKDTVARLAEEFRTFRELMYSMLGLLRKQINECSMAIDTMETRHRRKALLFLGVAEVENEDCKKAIVDILQGKLAVNDCTAASIVTCHRLGSVSSEHHRPVLVRFSSLQIRSAAWRAKTALKGSSISVREFLTRTRQAIFNRARLHFGTRACWTQDGVVVVKVPDGSRHKITTIEELQSLTKAHPRPPGASQPGVNKTALQKV